MERDKRGLPMDIRNNSDMGDCISKEKALELLFKSEGEMKPSAITVFDEYGNYSFPTDLAVDTPNTAIGTPLGLSVIRETI